MIVSTNQGNPNALKLVIAAKFAREPVTVEIVKPSGELTSSHLFSLFWHNWHGIV